jgi:hypothetical protein
VYDQSANGLIGATGTTGVGAGFGFTADFGVAAALTDIGGWGALNMEPLSASV